MNYPGTTKSVRGDVCKAVLTCALLAVSVGASASDLDFLLNSVWSKLSTEDIGLAESTALGLLKDGKLGESRDWANQNSAAKGTVKIIKIFHSQEGFSCKTLRADNTAGGMHGRAAYPVCEVKPGDWKLYSDAKPASP
jgi:surface antigen